MRIQGKPPARMLPAAAGRSSANQGPPSLPGFAVLRDRSLHRGRRGVVGNHEENVRAGHAVEGCARLLFCELRAVKGSNTMRRYRDAVLKTP
jgi:hypothetical protein